MPGWRIAFRINADVPNFPFQIDRLACRNRSGRCHAHEVQGIGGVDGPIRCEVHRLIGKDQEIGGLGKAEHALGNLAGAQLVEARRRRPGDRDVQFEIFTGLAERDRRRHGGNIAIGQAIGDKTEHARPAARNREQRFKFGLADFHVRRKRGHVGRVGDGGNQLVLTAGKIAGEGDRQLVPFARPVHERACHAHAERRQQFKFILDQLGRLGEIDRRITDRHTRAGGIRKRHARRCLAIDRQGEISK